MQPALQQLRSLPLQLGVFCSMVSSSLVTSHTLRVGLLAMAKSPPTVSRSARLRPAMLPSARLFWIFRLAPTERRLSMLSNCVSAGLRSISKLAPTEASAPKPVMPVSLGLSATLKRPVTAVISGNALIEVSSALP
jgi:hypothetical protein